MACEHVVRGNNPTRQRAPTCPCTRAYMLAPGTVSEYRNCRTGLPSRSSAGCCWAPPEAPRLDQRQSWTTPPTAGCKPERQVKWLARKFWSNARADFQHCLGSRSGLEALRAARLCPRSPVRSAGATCPGLVLKKSGSLTKSCYTRGPPERWTHSRISFKNPDCFADPAQTQNALDESVILY
jgi:hypothetical protein